MHIQLTLFHNYSAFISCNYLSRTLSHIVFTQAVLYNHYKPIFSFLAFHDIELHQRSKK
jgi:hypothetical protein